MQHVPWHGPVYLEASRWVAHSHTTHSHAHLAYQTHSLFRSHASLTLSVVCRFEERDGHYDKSIQIIERVCFQPSLTRTYSDTVTQSHRHTGIQTHSHTQTRTHSFVYVQGLVENQRYAPLWFAALRAYEKVRAVHSFPPISRLISFSFSISFSISISISSATPWGASIKSARLCRGR